MRNLLEAEVYKLIINKYFVNLFLYCVIFAIISVATINVMDDILIHLPSELLESVYSYGVYNFGIVQVESLDMLNYINGRMFLGLSFSGLLLPIIIAIFTSMYISKEFSNGGIKYFIAKGQPRFNIYLSKFIILAVATTIYVIVYVVVCVGTSSIIWGIGNIRGEFLNIINLIVVQVFMHIAFMGFCMATAVFYKTSSVANVSNICSIIFIPILLNIVDLLFKNNLDISRFWILNCISRMSKIDISTNLMITGIAILTITISFSFMIGLIVFKKSEIN